MTAVAPITPEPLTLPRAPAAEALPNIVGLGREALRAALVEAGTPEAQAAMRVGQIWQWLYHRGARDFGTMTNLSRSYRDELAARFSIGRPEIVTRQVSADGTRKYLLRVAGGPEIETVYIPETDRGRSACRARSAARSPARSATPARKSWCAI
jgi:23S rRNA (adenine2503-C2)-methyltransferase